MTRHLLDMNDLDRDEILTVLRYSVDEARPKVLDGQGVALLFEKPSARTRHSAEMAVHQLAGIPVYVRPEEVDLDGRESVEDVTRTLNQYHSLIAARTYSHSTLERMANVSNVPIVNLLSNDAHPVQTLADMLTIQQEFDGFDNLKVAWVGDASNVARSLALGLSKFGIPLHISTPKGYSFSELDRQLFVDCNVEIIYCESPQKAVEGADVVNTDAWYAMGQETEKTQRRVIFKDYQVNVDLMSKAKSNAIFLHCLPAHRGEEVTDEVIDGSQSRVWVQAQNRMHTKRGLFRWLLEQG